MQVILWLEWKPHKFSHCCTNNIMRYVCGIYCRHVWDSYEICKYHIIMDAISCNNEYNELDTRSRSFEVASYTTDLLQ